jgi:hypothetical protein
LHARILTFLARVLAAAAAASVALVLPALPDLVAAGLAGALFLGVGQLIGMVPAELRDALGPHGSGAPRANWVDPLRLHPRANSAAAAR